jgi:hypothetical protein
MNMIPERYQKIVTLKSYTALSPTQPSPMVRSQSCGLFPKNVSLVLHRALKTFEKKFKERFPTTEINYDYFVRDC